MRALDLDGFRRWLGWHLERWERDPVFLQRRRICDLRRAHPRISVLEKECRRAAARDAAGPHFLRLQRLERELEGTEKAVAGLAGALEEAPPEQRAGLREKRDAFLERRTALREAVAELVRRAPLRQVLLRIHEELRELREETGLDREEARLAELLRERGRRSGRSGGSFEELALALTRAEILPELAPAGGGRTDAELRVLSGVTLGAARVELDLVVVRRPPDASRPVEVLAVVEAKRNVNDVGRGFRQRRENLAWLSGDQAGYDAAAYRTKRFASGHFEGEAVHREEGEVFVFARGSFQRFAGAAATPGPSGPLYFATRTGPLWGLSASSLARVGHRVATDERWAPDDGAYLEELLRWCRSLADPLETPDVLRLYCSAAGGRRILLVEG